MIFWQPTLFHYEFVIHAIDKYDETDLMKLFSNLSTPSNNSNEIKIIVLIDRLYLKNKDGISIWNKIRAPSYSY